MKILYVHQYFKTPEEGGAIRSYHIAKGMVEAGHEVELITSHNQSGYKKKDVEGVTVHYLPIAYSNKMNVLSRVRSFYKFVSMATSLAYKIKDVDLCYATSTPLTVGYVALRLKEKSNIPFIFEVRDLWPDAPIELKVIKYQFLKDYFFSLEKRIYSQADKIVALSPDIQKNIETKISDTSKVFMIPNFSDCDFFEPEEKHPFLERKYKNENSFTVSYLGAIGKANHLEYLLDIAEKCSENQLSIKFLIGGDGSEKKRLEKRAKIRKLVNVKFLGNLSKKEVKEVLSVTDATYTSFLNAPILGTGSPNKFFDSLASGKLTIVNSKGWLKDLVEKNKCGFYVDPENPIQFVEEIKNVLESNRKEEMGRKARELAENLFDMGSCLTKLMSFVIR